MQIFSLSICLCLHNGNFHRISMDIINALHFCHANHLVHLDVKPQNVFVAVINEASEVNYICKLFDFGCSTFTNQESCSTNQVRKSRYDETSQSFQKPSTLLMNRCNS